MRPQAVLLGSIAVMIIAGPAQAVDYNDWDGFYSGLSLGQRIQVSDWKQTGLYDTEGGYLADTNISHSSRDGTGYASIYGGYNWHLNDRVVAGLELSVGYADNESKSRLYLPGNLFISGQPLPTSAETSLASSWDAKLRGRLGYLVAPNTLLYGAAGLAVTQLKATTTCKGPVGLMCFGPDRKETTSKTLLGWTVGLGIESALSRQITARVEYQYTAYESSSFMAMHPERDTYNFGDGSGSAATGVKGQANLTTQAFTLGLTYKF